MNKKQRLYKKRQETFERKIFKKYPWLHYRQWRLDKKKRSINPNNKWAESKKYLAYYDIPEGWKRSFGKLMLDEINKVVKEDGLKDYHIEQIKEKYGTLRWYDCGGNKKIDRITSAFEQLSGNICLLCGKPDVKMTTCGWYYPCCKECWEKNKYNHMPYEEAISSIDNGIMPDSYKVTRFSKDGDETVEYDISEYANKIRELYIRRNKKE